jgi:hypothetical protein
MRWDSDYVNNIAYHAVWRKDQLVLNEINDMANWGTVYYATDNSFNLTFQSGEDKVVRNTFSSSGQLKNSKDVEWRSIPNRWPVFGFAKSFGMVSSNPESALFSIGLTQRNAIEFLGKGDKSQILPSLWTQYWQDETLAVRF